MKKNQTTPVLQIAPDQYGPLYRICPTDQVAFMTFKKAKIFCSQKCFDEYMNKKRRAEMILMSQTKTIGNE